MGKVRIFGEFINGFVWFQGKTCKTAMEARQSQIRKGLSSQSRNFPFYSI